MNSATIINGYAVNETLYAESYKKALSAILAVSDSELLQVTLDVPTLVTTVLGSLPAILAVRDDIAKQAPQFDLSKIDNLDTYAMALSYAHTCYLTACEPADGLRDLNDQAMALRERLHSDVTTACTRGLINPIVLKGYSGQSRTNLSPQTCRSWPRLGRAQAAQGAECRYRRSHGRSARPATVRG